MLTAITLEMKSGKERWRGDGEAAWGLLECDEVDVESACLPRGGKSTESREHGKTKRGWSRGQQAENPLINAIY